MMMDVAINGICAQGFKDYKKTDTSVQEDKPVSSGQNQVYQMKKRERTPGYRGVKKGNPSAQVNRLGRRGQGRQNKM